MGPRPAARLSLGHLTEAALSQNAIGQERARQELLGYFRALSARSVKRSQGLGKEIRNYISHDAVGL